MDDKLIAAVAAVLLAVAGWLKSHSEVAEVKADREQTKKSRDTEIALLKSELETQKKQAEDFRAYIEKRLTEGDEQEHQRPDKYVAQFDSVLRPHTGGKNAMSALVSAGIIALVLVFGRRWFKEEDWRDKP